MEEIHIWEKPKSSEAVTGREHRRISLESQREGNFLYESKFGRYKRIINLTIEENLHLKKIKSKDEVSGIREVKAKAVRRCTFPAPGWPGQHGQVITGAGGVWRNPTRLVGCEPVKGQMLETRPVETKQWGFPGGAVA